MGNYKERNGTTRVGDLLRNMGDIGKPILQAAAGLSGQQWLNKVADQITTSKDLQEEQKAILMELHKQDLVDLQHSRESNARIQESAHASWMAKNMPFIYDAFILGIWGFMTVYLVLSWIGIIKATDNVDMTGVVGIYAGVTGLATQVMQFHRGSSAGSQSKNSIFGTIVRK